MAQRLVRAKRKIRAAAIPFRVPSPDAMPTRLPDVLQVVYLMFTEGHRPSRGRAVTAPELCEESIRLARRLSALMAEEPEVDGLLALLLLTHARRAARADDGGRIVLLGDQDRGAWDREMIREGIELVEAALARRRPGAYQLQAAIAACHADAADLASTDWAQIAALYGLLWSRQPSPIVAANRAVAVAMSDGPAAGLAVLEELGGNPTVARWAPLHVARAELLAQIGRREDALAAYRTAADLPGPEPERELIAARIAALVDSAR
jgi:RNA polymerase sigma-70 factor (ECF subfamily)